MPRQSIVRYKCDRCPEAHDTIAARDTDAKAPAGWSQLDMKPLDDQPQDEKMLGVTLCPKCSRSLRRWRSERDPIAEAAPPTPPRTPPPFSVVDGSPRPEVDNSHLGEGTNTGAVTP